MRTHPVDKLLEQHCYKSAAGLLQLVRFYVCRKDPGWGWSRDFTKIDWLRGGGEGRVSNCMRPQKNVTLQLQGVD